MLCNKNTWARAPAKTVIPNDGATETDKERKKYYWITETFSFIACLVMVAVMGKKHRAREAIETKQEQKPPNIKQPQEN